MAERAPFRIEAAARHARCIEKHGAVSVSRISSPLSLTPLETVMHVPEHHKLGPAPLRHLHERKRQIGITPIAGRLLPVTPARICGIGSQTCGAGMGQQH